MSSVKTRDSALNAIKRFMTKSVDEAFTMDSENIVSYLQLLNEQWVRFNTAQGEVELSCGVDSVAVEENARIQAETWYSTASANFNRVQKCRIDSQHNVAKTVVSAPIRLPKMELPIFSGHSTDWIGFHDVFSSLVDSNSALSSVQKLHYLRSCLRGDALKIISGFKISDANYVEAWGLLKSRYKVMRVIVEAHLRAMVDVKSAMSDSADAIKGVLDAVQQHIRELKALGRPVQFWDDWLVHQVVGKLAFETRKQWELSLISEEPPSFEQLTTFLEIRCRSLSMLSSFAASETVNVAPASGIGPASVFHAVRKQNDVCCYCNGPHKIYGCEHFRILDLTAKSNFVVQARLCLNCLSSGHLKDRCNSGSSCRVCSKRHHTLLHGAAVTKNPNPFSSAAAHSYVIENASSECDPTSSADMSRLPACLNFNANPPYPVEKVVLLSTALVKVLDCSGRWQPARLLFDSGSHASFVTEACVQRLGVPQTSSEVCITGIGSALGGPVRGEVSLSLSSHCSDQCFLINALILPKITSHLPAQIVAVSPWPHIQGLPLADPQFMQPAQIDILIGMDVMDKLICAEFRKGPPGTPMTQLTVFGWTLFGAVNTAVPSTRNLQSLYCDIQPYSALNRLWELNASPEKTHLPSMFAALKELRAEKRFARDKELCLRYSKNKQPLYLSEEILLRSSKRPIALRFSLLLPQSLLDENNLLRAKGRFRNSQAATYVPQPIIINKTVSFAMINVRQIFKLILFAEPGIKQTFPKRHCWVIICHIPFRNLPRECNRNFAAQDVGYLPADRKTYARRFACIAIDFDGPLNSHTYKVTYLIIEWHTGSKCIKYHLKRTLSDTLLSPEEFNTLIQEVENLANRCPLCDNSSDAVHLQVLNPRPFLGRGQCKPFPEPEGQGFCGNLHQRRQTFSDIKQHFQRLWRNEYLQHRIKWLRPIRNTDMVSAFSVSNPSTKWTLRRIENSPGES